MQIEFLEDIQFFIYLGDVNVVERQRKKKHR